MSASSTSADTAAPGAAPLQDYEKFSRAKKLAVFLVTIGPESAAELMKHFDDNTVEAVTKEMTQLGLIPVEQQEASIREFSSVILESTKGVLGGSPYAQRTLELAKGDFKAASIMGRVGPSGTSIDVIKDIAEMEGRQICNLIKNEQPQTIAFVLSYLETPKAAEILTMLSPEMREEVVERLGTIESTSLELVGKVVRSLGKHFDVKARPTFHRSGGVRSVADVLNALDKDISKTLLAKIEERNATLGAAVRKKMFGFEDLNRMSVQDLQRVMREVDSSNLAVSMKSASEGLRNKIYAAISKRAAESLKEEISMLGPVRLRDVEQAQDAIIQVVRRLEEEGEISLEAQESNVVV
ncbi:MAG: flagellar motor switch protein FliG [Opitutaceae bacterium]